MAWIAFGNPSGIPFGLVVRNARKSRKLTQAELGRRVKRSQAAIVRLESCDFEPSLELVVKIGDALEIPAWKLLRAACQLKAAQQGGDDAVSAL